MIQLNLRKKLNSMFNNAVKNNHLNILNLVELNKKANLLDLGCDDGTFTDIVARKIGTKYKFGVDLSIKNLKKANLKIIKVFSFDLNKKFKLKSNFFDVIHTNQVIEHLYNSDNFLSEIYRVLKPGGYAIISTENASSWCNIFASVLGWQIFSLTNFSNKKESIGNPLALHQSNKQGPQAWNHVRIYNIKGLSDYIKIFGFKIEKVKGAGYFPFPTFFSNFDSIHSHFITFKVRK